MGCHKKCLKKKSTHNKWVLWYLQSRPETFRRFWSVANFGTFYFLLKIKILAKRERGFKTKFAIAPSGSCAITFFLF